MELLDIKFECSTCGQHLVVESAAAGLETDCPSCRSSLNVPRASSRRFRPVAEPEVDPEAYLLRQELAGTTLLAAERERHVAILSEKLTLAREEAALHRTERDREAAIAAEKIAALSEVEARLAETGQKLTASAAAHAELREAHDLARQYTTAQAAQMAAREREAAEALATVAAQRDELRASEGRLGALESELAGAKLLLEEKAALEARLAGLEESCREAESLRRTGAHLREEAESLKRQLGESAAGREALSLRQRLEQAEERTGKAERAAAHVTAEAARLREMQSREHADREALLQRCAAAEKLAASDSDGAARRDREVLRGVIERQKAELQDQYLAVRRLRRGRSGLRALYAVLLLIIGGAAGAAVMWLQHWPLLAEWLR